MIKPTADEVRRLFNYNPETGIFTWRVHRPGRMPGDVAGGTARIENRTYWRVCINYRTYLAHRVAVLYMTGEWPDREVDHADGNGLNNAWSNLRLATRCQNAMNCRLSRANTSGFKGVCFNKLRGKYMAYIGVNGKRQHLGYFDDPVTAHQAYVAAAVKHFGEFARAA